jgi:outer membrane lipoprotein SlyB
VGGLFGKAAESVAVDAPAFEYVVQTRRGELISVTQREDKALVVGQKILVIAGTQARVVPDYTVAHEPAAAPPPPPQRAAPDLGPPVLVPPPAPPLPMPVPPEGG